MSALLCVSALCEGHLLCVCEGQHARYVLWSHGRTASLVHRVLCPQSLLACCVCAFALLRVQPCCAAEASSICCSNVNGKTLYYSKPPRLLCPPPALTEFWHQQFLFRCRPCAGALFLSIVCTSQLHSYLPGPLPPKLLCRLETLETACCVAAEPQDGQH